MYPVIPFLFILGGFILALGATILMNDEGQRLRPAMILLGFGIDLYGWFLFARW